MMSECQWHSGGNSLCHCAKGCLHSAFGLLYLPELQFETKFYVGGIGSQIADHSMAMAVLLFQ